MGGATKGCRIFAFFRLFLFLPFFFDAFAWFVLLPSQIDSVGKGDGEGVMTFSFSLATQLVEGKQRKGGGERESRWGGNKGVQDFCFLSTDFFFFYRRLRMVCLAPQSD